MKAAPLLLIAASFLAAGCSRPVATPRPYGFQRTELYKPVYRKVALPIGSDSIAVNAAAIVEPGEKSGWFNIIYPAYGITVNCTMIENLGGSLEIPLANRMERMMRNVAMSAAEVTSWSGVTMIVSKEALRTPVQFLATDSVSWILSGVAVADFPPDADADSVGPLISAVSEDMDVLLRSL